MANWRIGGWSNRDGYGDLAHELVSALRRNCMTWSEGFLYTVATLEGGAAVSYLIHRQYRLAVIWACYALATAALGGMK